MIPIIYKNIKARRKELGLTQIELAQKIGYTDRSVITRIEKGEIDLPLSKVEDFAKALDTTPSILLGLNVSDTDDFAPDEQKELDNYKDFIRSKRTK